MCFMFFSCKSLISLPDISKWYISRLDSIYGIFKGCISLIPQPDDPKLIFFTSLQNHFELVYKYNKNLRLFGDDFVNKNYNYCFIEYKSKLLDLCSNFKLNNDFGFKKDELITIKLKIIKNEINMSHMFDGCNDLISIKINENNLNINTENKIPDDKYNINIDIYNV